MAKKREEREDRKKKTGNSICDLDDGFVAPGFSFRNLSFASVKNILIHSRYVQILLSLTIIGAILRFVNLGFNSLWLDEASTYQFAIKSIPAIWQATTGGEFNPPLFYWIEHFMLMFGNNEVVLRFVPALAGILTIPLIYLIGKEFVDRNVGIIAAAICTISPFLLFYSQEARAYSLGLFFIAFAMVFFLKAMKTNELSSWLLFGVLSALALWAHFYTIVVTGSLLLYALIVKIPDLRKDIREIKYLVAAGVVFVVVSLPLLFVALQLFTSRTTGGPSFGLQGADVIITTFQQLSGFSAMVMFLFLLLFVVGVMQAFHLDRNKGIFLVALMVLPFAISWFLSYKIPMVPRYLIILVPVYFIGIALAYKPVYGLISNRGVVYGFIALLVLLSVTTPFFSSYYTSYSKEDWRGFAGQVRQAAQPGDAIVFVPGYISQPFDYYYSNATEETFEYGASSAEQLAAVAGSNVNNTVFYVVTGDISSADPSGDSIAWLQEHAKGAQVTSGIYLFTNS
ncbi:glycosyltransferase family 39 protein [Methanoregula sp.]|uniref:glycosyltransferase family 39 protein n=1 Tax=Methanoregula sp. TaxID=2052170 RepID=UPI0023720483|nr:glycosyltransferase family 39 protein [Methanoregula sp.]MDD1686817.1 glycosyltransferase family 39 protein [Methanoregula sp.]